MTRKRIVIAGVVLAAVAAAAGGAAALQGRDPTASSEEEASGVELTTIRVAQQDLVTYAETSATLAYAESATVSSPVAGTVTSIVAAGSTIEAGAVVATIDGQPLVSMYGDVPGWRDLSTSSEDGVDVRQLETNLVALGYDPDGAIEIDETFDDATAAAVELWETALVIDDPDGEVPQGQIVYTRGSLLVVELSTSVGAGVDSGSALFDSRVTERRFAVPATVGTATAESPGTLDHVAAAGTEVATGTVLFWHYGTPVVAVETDIASFPALDRDLSVGVDEGADVRILEQLLVDAGADPDGTMVVDDTFDDATAEAVVRYWQALGAVAADAVIEAADVLVPAGSIVGVPSGLEVGETQATATPTADLVALELTTLSRIVSTTASVGDDTFAEGETVDVVLADDSVVAGTVISVGTVATASDGGEASVPVTISVSSEDTAAFADLIEIPVTLRMVSEETLDAFVVPVTALVALAEGGYAIEVLTGTDAAGTPATQLIGVETGQFADGMVAITADGLSTDLDVVVPA